MKFFSETFRELESWKDIEKCIKSKISPVCATGLSHIHKAQFIYSIYNESPILVITESEAAAKKLCDDIAVMSGDENYAVLFPSRELALTKVEGFSREYEHQRISALSKLIRGKSKIIAASIEAVMEPVIPKDILKNSTIAIKSGAEVNLEELKTKLINMGYIRCDKVEGPSQFSVRGSIADIFPVQSAMPVRMEFWGDDVDSISYFDPETQRRTDSLESIEIAPAVETVTDRLALADKIDSLAKKIRSRKSDIVRARLAEDSELLREGAEVQCIDKYIPLIYDKIPLIFDYFNGITVFCEYVNAAEHAKGVTAQYNEDCKILLEEGELCKGLEGHYCELSDVLSETSKGQQIFLSNFIQGLDRVGYKKIISFEALHNAPWGGEMRQLDEDLKSLCERGYRTMLIAGSEKTLPIIRQDLMDDGIKCDIAKEDSQCLPGRVLLMTGSLSGGYEYPENKTAVITQSKAASSKKKKKKHKKGEEIRSLSDITAGDLVVHSMHGIGRFVGIRKLELEGVTKDYITIQYAGKDVLYVPVTQLDMVSRYIGPRDDTGVKLNKLSSSEWQKTRNNVKRAVKDMAHELTALYAKREKSKGFAFLPDDEMQRDFESRFPYTETDDQLQSINEIKEDMERIRPMDRLLCGDVGFGKTEVAFRAAMKCVASGKQCAILAPTTVLAMQHFQTALRRFEHFPVTIELLSRFRTPKQQEILKKLKKGLIDIIIGTHRLVQKDVEFKSLGLAIIDEEQRFGVAHKEKFKEHFTGVDMLTLSATPIPRTLNMAMSGIRDMSVIDEPPQDRHPVQTYVVEYNPGMLIQAINKELKRGGQVYYIHNRVETISSCAAKLQEWVPDARIAYAHGQMTEEAMSEIWRQLVEHEIDILVCTTIIETGVDVPNVNTLIIEDSDYFGLSQLYQLRGRVGRSNRRAFAYFTFRREKILTEVASKRLNAMREFTQFGSGFRIAMRDLEIRGAGSILGGRQHGHMESVGYDMYIRLLTEAIAEEKGEPVKKAADCAVDIQIDAHIPENYIESLAQRLDIYKKIAAVQNEEDKMEMIDELIDRYGDPPKSVEGLINASLLRNTAASLGITEIQQRKENMIFYIERPSPEQIDAISSAYKGRVAFNCLSKPYISVKLDRGQKPERLMESVLSVMKNAM